MFDVFVFEVSMLLGVNKDCCPTRAARAYGFYCEFLPGALAGVRRSVFVKHSTDKDVFYILFCVLNYSLVNDKTSTSYAE